MNDTLDKTFSVQEAADILGVSEITIRRRIQDRQLVAVMGSKKNGYRITELSLLNYAKSHKTKLDSSLNSKTFALASLPIFPFSLLTAGASFLSTAKSSNESEKFLNDPVIIDKFIRRLNVEIEDFDSQIKLLQFKLANSNSDSEKINNEKKLLTLQSDKIKIKKDILDLELRKAIILNERKGV